MFSRGREGAHVTNILNETDLATDAARAASAAVAKGARFDIEVEADRLSVKFPKTAKDVICRVLRREHALAFWAASSPTSEGCRIVRMPLGRKAAWHADRDRPPHDRVH
jgi:hypothetical protein